MRLKRATKRVSTVRVCTLRLLTQMMFVALMPMWSTKLGTNIMTSAAFSSTRTGFKLRPSPSSPSRLLSTKIEAIHSVAILGGGLAGMSTAFHLLEKQPNGIQITIFDKAPVGTGGASSVAGGLLHPLSPRGKLVHGGRAGLVATNMLVQHACQYQPCILSKTLHRVALHQGHVEQLQQTAHQLPEYCEWINEETMQSICHSPNVLGGLKLSNGCQVLHVPSYLQGLYKACQAKCNKSVSGSSRISWSLINDSDSTKHEPQWTDFDAVVLAAGAGLFQTTTILSVNDFPVDLIRGQSIEMKLPKEEEESNALLCGKYISPLVDKHRVLIGATHEWSSTPLSTSQVVEELKDRTMDMAPYIWENGEIEKVTCGYRVQSRRGNQGRLPIIGRLHNFTNSHENVYMFTGLSSRGLLYHGLYGDLLTNVILGMETENESRQQEYNLDWWRENTNNVKV